MGLHEFRKFLLRGNVIDLAVAVIVGVAFSAVVNSLVADIFTPLIAAVIGEADFSTLSVTVNDSEVTYGNFLNALLSFVIVGTVVFYFIVTPVNRMMSRFQANPDTPEPATKKCPFCYTEVPKQATRCSACTSGLEAVAQEQVS